MVMWPYRFVFLQVHLFFFFLWAQPQSFWKYCVNMWHWDTIWLSLFNYMSSSIELRPLVPAPPSSAHLLKQTCSSDVAKHCAFFGMLKACLRGVTLVLWYCVAGGKFFEVFGHFSKHTDFGKPLSLWWRSRVWENKISICRMALLLRAPATKMHVQRAPLPELPSWILTPAPHCSAWHRAHHGLWISHHMWRPSDGSQAEAWVQEAPRPALCFFFWKYRYSSKNHTDK